MTSIHKQSALPYPDLDLQLVGSPAEHVPQFVEEAPKTERLLSGLPVDAASIPPLRMGFEEARDLLGQLERLWFEPDGAFFWNGAHGEAVWQIAGMLYDFGGAIRWVEIRGQCPLDAWETLLACLGWPEQPLLAQLRRERQFVRVEDLRLWWDRT